MQTASRCGLDTDVAAMTEGCVDLCQVGGHPFPAVWWEGGWVPEVRSYEMKVLPHQLGQEVDRTFPRAVVLSPEPPRDLDFEKSELEQEGERLGRQRLPQSASR